MTQPLTVLHVDDDPRTLDLVASLLEEERPSIEIRSESSPDDALAHLEDERIDCLLCDYQMPEMDGLAFFDVVREHRPELPFVLVTGRGSETVASRAISAGVSDYVPKGDLLRNQEILVNRIENLVSQYRSEQRAAHQERLNAVIREVNRTLVRSETRAEIEREVCGAIGEASLYDEAWIGTRENGTIGLVSRAGTTEQVAPASPISEPVDRALETESVAVARVDDESGDAEDVGSAAAASCDSADSWLEVASRRDTRAVAAVPVTYDGERYGVVVVLTDRPDAFDEGERSVLAELAADVAHAIYAAATEAQLRRREKHLSNAQSVAKLGSWYKEIESDTITWSDEVYEIFERPREAGPLDHEAFMEYVHPEDRDAVEARWEAAKAGEEYDIEHRIVADGETKWVREKADLEFDDDGTPQRGIGVVQDVTEQKAYERRLKALNEAMGQLHRADSREAVGRTVVRILSETIEEAAVGIHLLDAEAGVLEPVSYTTGDDRQLETVPAYEPGDGPGWEAFVEGERRTCRGSRCRALLPEDSVSSALVIPIDGCGVIVVATDDPSTVLDTEAERGGRGQSFDDQTIELVEIVASAAGEAFVRIEHERDLDETEATIREQTAELEALKRATRQGRRVLRAVVDADDRETVEAGVCERLAETEGYAFVWLARLEPTRNRLVPSATAGDGRGYVEAIDRSVDGPSVAPAVRTARRRELTLVENTTEKLQAEPWRREALARGFRSSLSVPLRVDDVIQGVLTIHATEVGVFDGLTREVLSELGRTVAYGVSRASERGAILGSRTIEIAVEIRDEAFPWLRLARAVDATLEVESTVGREDGTVAFLSLPASDEKTVCDRLESVPEVVDVSRTDRDRTIRVRLTRPEAATPFSEVGAAVTGCAADPERATVRLELPSEADVRSAIESIATQYDRTQLVSRTVSETGESAGAGGPALLEGLTERQRDALRTAYLEGFFDWPRETTIEDLAALFDIASPTYSRHLRIGQRKLLAEVFDDS